MNRREFSRAFATLRAAVAIPMGFASTIANAEVEDVLIRFIAEAWGGSHD